MPAGLAQRLTTAALAGLLACSVLLSWWASSLSLVKLPAADLWQHVNLVAQASNGEIHVDTLLEKHNQLHFIPLPKLVYALDIAFFSGSGLFTSLVSAIFTLLCCLLFARAIFDIGSLGLREKTNLSLLTASWLVCILQWESFVNPANLQWSGMNAGLALMAIGFAHRPICRIAGAVLAICCGTPWWLLLVVILVTRLPAKRIAAGITVLTGIALLWEMLNAYWLHAQPPLPILAIHLATPVAAGDLENLLSIFFKHPTDFYLPWMQNFLAFLTSFCVPPFERWLPANLMAWLAPIPIATCWLACQQNNNKSLMFLTVTLLFTALAAAVVRSHLPGAYTSRFANAGLLFASAGFVVVYLASRNYRYGNPVWYALVAMYTALLMLTAMREAQGIVHDSNQRRLSQVAYALDIQDARATSEMPFAPLMAQSYREINERKGVLAEREIGIYNSQEHRVFAGKDPLPEEEITCDYVDIQIKPVKDDQAARKITGQTINSDGSALSSILFLDSRKQAIGYGIPQVAGKALIEQLMTPRRWAGFAKWPIDGKVTIVAYDKYQHCDSFTVP